MEALAAFLSKISSYNLLSNLIPGAIFCVIIKYLVGYDFISVSIIELLIIFYFSGMVIGRLGSLIVECLLRKLKVVSYIDHKSYVAAELIDKKIASICEANNIYRSMITAILTAILLKLYRAVVEFQWEFGYFSEWMLLLTLLLLFVFAYRKQTSYLIGRIDFHTKNKKAYAV